MRIDTKLGQATAPCSFDQFLNALENPAPFFDDTPRTIWSRVTVLPSSVPTEAPAIRRHASAMMAPAESPFWIGVVRSMRARQERIGVACLLVAMTLFIMIAGRLAWAYAAGAF